MADTAAAKKTRTSSSLWARTKPRNDPDTARRQQLWSAVNEYVGRHGGWITSPPGTQDVRIETPINSELPAKLSELGYRVLHVGTGTRA
jgi:hypothetical protein